MSDPKAAGSEREESREKFHRINVDMSSHAPLNQAERPERRGGSVNGDEAKPFLWASAEFHGDGFHRLFLKGAHSRRAMKRRSGSGGGERVSADDMVAPSEFKRGLESALSDQRELLEVAEVRALHVQEKSALILWGGERAGMLKHLERELHPRGVGFAGVGD